MAPSAALPVVMFVARKVLAHALDLLADRTQPLKHRIDEVAVLLQIRAALVGDGVEFLRALGLRGDVARFFEVGERRVDDAGTRRRSEERRVGKECRSRWS